MKLKVGDTFKFTSKLHKGAYWVDKVTRVIGDEYVFTTISGSGKGSMESHSVGWIVPDESFYVTRIGHRTTKLGKILYK